MTEDKDTNSVLADFEEIRITISSPQMIMQKSSGEVTKSETINYRTFKPDKDGLFCERMGHIKLVVPAVHTWFLRSNPSAISNLLGMGAKTLERVIYFSAYMISGVDSEAKDALYADLETAVDTEKKTLETRYEELSEAEGADIKELAKSTTVSFHKNIKTSPRSVWVQKQSMKHLKNLI